MRDSSHLVPRPNLNTTRAHHEVIGHVEWNHPGDETCVREVEVQICCPPERVQLSKKDNVKASDDDESTDNPVVSGW